MRHQPGFGSNSLHQRIVSLDGIDRTDPQARQVWDQFQDAQDEIAKARLRRQVGPPGGQVDAGQHDFIIALVAQAFDLVDDHSGRDRP